MKYLNTPFIASLLCCVVLIVSCNNEKRTEEKTHTNEEQENERYDLTLKDKLDAFSILPNEAPNKDNVANSDKIKLGQLLYFDKRLSKNNTISCNSCHNLSTFGVDNEPTSPGDRGEKGSRNSPTVLNAAFHKTQFWDGRAKDVEEQAGMPILNPIEMAIPSKEFLVKRLTEIALYKELFKKAFPDEKQPLNYENIAKSIAAFERQLIAPSRFDKYLQGDAAALSVKEKKGLVSFINIGCVTCHSGSLLGGNSFQKFGVHGSYWRETRSTIIDSGRFDLTKDELDKFVFKVPSLRNVSKTQPYFHDGSIFDLRRAVEIMANVQLNYRISPSEIDNIVTFLKSLSGTVPKELTKAPEELKM